MPKKNDKPKTFEERVARRIVDMLTQADINRSIIDTVLEDSDKKPKKPRLKIAPKD